VAALIARGYGNIQIAAELQIARRTVETHVTALFNKLGLSNRTQVALWAVEHGLVASAEGKY
jgi:DNA-binding NarL/FixJ family response regulator